MTQGMNEAIPLSLYIHIPWCVRKCPYCDFNSHEVGDGIPERAYVDALLADLEQELPLVWGRRISTIFIGGGTPSLFSAEALERLLSGVRTLLPVLPDAEITLEANPGTVEAGRFEAYRSIGINRLSIGVQSFNSNFLKRLGRIHDAAEAHRAVEIAQQSGFDNFNIDLMFALPGQDATASLSDVREALAHQPAHISYYQLTLEPNTEFYQSPPVLPEVDDVAMLEQASHEALAEAGFMRYEVSAFAHSGKQAAHNLNYWEFGDYIGIGAGAHGKITDMHQQQIVRRRKQRQPARYMDRELSVLSSQETVGTTELPFEFMLNALRLTRGFDKALFQARTGLAWQTLETTIAALVTDGLLEENVNRIRPSPLGMRFLNDVMERFLDHEIH